MLVFVFYTLAHHMKVPSRLRPQMTLSLNPETIFQKAVLKQLRHQTFQNQFPTQAAQSSNHTKSRLGKGS